MMVIMIVIVFAFVLLLDYTALFKTKRTNEIVTYGVIYGVAAVLTVLYCLNIPLPSVYGF